MFAFKLFGFVLAVLLIDSASTEAARLTTLHSFCTKPQNSQCLDGQTPASRLVEIGGELYGTAATAGADSRGTLFRLSPAGSFTLVHAFCQEAHCSDGASPGHYLTRGPADAVYGVTTSGGTADGGTIFKLAKDGTFSLVYKFCSEAKCIDGIQPVSVLFGNTGNMFGTTVAGGRHGGGTAFKIDTRGVFHVLHDFCSQAGCVDGISPGALVRGQDGNFYGTTLAGGPNHAGTVFRMTPAGDVTILYSFCGTARCPDGEQPGPMLVQGQNGDFYGTTAQRGVDLNGTIFEISTAGAFRTIHRFCAVSNCNDGSGAADGLVMAKDGTFYGVAGGGGRYNYGLVFHLTEAGKYSIVYNFCALHGCFDGATPNVAPIFGTGGFLYGATGAGGDGGSSGTIYRLEP